MRNPIFIAVGLLLALGLACAGEVFAQDGSNDAARAAKAEASARKITNAQAFIGETEQALEMAHSGQYGKIKRGDLERLDEAKATIVSLLDGRENASKLEREQRLELYNAQELITAILRNNEKDRRICRRVQVTGSRVAGTECLTIAEREARTHAARESTARAQREGCVPGDFSSCAR